MWQVMAILAAVAAAGLGVRSGGGMPRLVVRTTRPVPRWARGRPGALALRKRLWAGGAAAAAVLILSGFHPLGILGGVVTAGVSTVALGFVDVGREARRRETLTLELPAALELMAAVLASGAPIRVAAREVADVAPPVVAAELRLILARVAVGESDASAWAASRERAVIGPVARDVARSVQSGTALTACLRRHAETGRRERRAKIASRARAVGVSAVVPMSVCSLPAFILIGVVPIVASVVLTFLR